MEVVIVDGVRTAIGNFLGSIASVPAVRMGAKVIEAVIRRTGIDFKEVDEVIMGNVLSAGLGQNPARQAAIYAGIPAETPAFTINKVCASGLKAVVLAAQTIRSGEAEMVIAGGMESMSQAPYLLRNLRDLKRFGNFEITQEIAELLIGKEVIDSMIFDGIWCCFNDVHMGRLAETISEKYGISREEQDKFALESHMKAVKAIESGKFKEEIVPIEVNGRQFDGDERPRKDTSLEKLGRLEPIFKKDGTVTAGNCCGLNDGAAALLVASSDKCEELGLRPLAKIGAYASAGIDPKWFGLAPIKAVKRLLEKSGREIGDFDLFEVNEPFAVTTLAVQRELKIDLARMNVNGGAIALGHPIGATGARILVTLLHALKDRGKKLGLATLCLGGGAAVALSVEMLG